MMKQVIIPDEMKTIVNSSLSKSLAVLSHKIQDENYIDARSILWMMYNTLVSFLEDD